MTNLSVEAIVAELAARNIRWDRMRRRIAAALASERPEHEPEYHMGPYVAVARQHGSGAAELAGRVGAALGWPVLDCVVLDLVAAHLHVNPSMLDLLDRDAASWVSDVLGDLMPHAMITRETYTHELRRVLQLLAVHGEVVILGRDANFFLPAGRGLSVRVVATIEDRIARVCSRSGKDRESALDHIKEADQARAHAVSHAFGRDVEDPLVYDLILNSSRCRIEELADAVIHVCRARWPRQEPGAAGPGRIQL